MKRTITISIATEYRPLVDRLWLRRAVKTVLDAEKIAEAIEVGLLVTGDTTVRRLNRDYRGLDRTTDVLSFAMENRAGDGFVSPPDSVRHLGEVIISYPQAVIQAQDQGHAGEREVAILAVHGILHLLGYDHEQPEPARAMRAREAAILNSSVGQGI